MGQESKKRAKRRADWKETEWESKKKQKKEGTKRKRNRKKECKKKSTRKSRKRQRDNKKKRQKKRSTKEERKTTKKKGLAWLSLHYVTEFQAVCDEYLEEPNQEEQSWTYQAARRGCKKDAERVLEGSERVQMVWRVSERLARRCKR